MDTPVPDSADIAQPVTDPAEAGTSAAASTNPGNHAKDPAFADLAHSDPFLPHVIVNDQVLGDPGYQPVDLYGQTGMTPVVASCPHAGRTYPAAMMRLTGQPISGLRGLEDFGVDCLLGALPSTGICLLVNRLSRAYLDVNRNSAALDPSMFVDRTATMMPFPDKRTRQKDGVSKALAAIAQAKPDSHVRAGYGLLPRLTATRQPIYGDRLPVEEAQRRINVIHTPYHATLADLLQTAHRRFDQALLVDFHSMPAYDRQNTRLPDIVLGDGGGTTINKDTGAAIAKHLSATGLTVGWNHPYAGGHITRHYGDARGTQQSLQIEINRDLYMDGPTRLNIEKTKQLADIIGGLGRFMVTLLAPTAR